MSKTLSNRSWRLAQQIESNQQHHHHHHHRRSHPRSYISRTTPFLLQHQRRNYHHQKHDHLLLFKFNFSPSSSSTQQWQPSCLQQQRLFSTSPPTRIAGGPGSMRNLRKSKMGPALSVQKEKQTEQAIRKGLLTNDVGLLPGTFIMPMIEKRPSWIRAFAQRWKLEKKRFLTRVAELGSYLTFRHIGVRPKPPLTIRAIRTIPETAERLQGKMYEHFASGDLAGIESEICDGLKGSLRARIAQRPAKSSLRWKFHKRLSKPKLMSLRAILTPLDANKKIDKDDAFGVVQAVVRLHSRQSLQHVRQLRERQGDKMVTKEALFDALGRQIAPEEAEERALADSKESVEYVVVQQLLRHSQLGEWMIWGTTQETTVAKLEQEESKGKTTAQPA